MYFGDKLDDDDSFQFVFGCVDKETNLFYDQIADGILGLGRGRGLSAKDEVPIYDALYNANLIAER